MNYTPSKPFSNHSAYEHFTANSCDRCKKFRLDVEHGVPKPDSCRIELKLDAAQMNDSYWPGEDIVKVGEHSHICLHFESNAPAITASYKKLFNEEW